MMIEQLERWIGSSAVARPDAARPVGSACSATVYRDVFDCLSQGVCLFGTDSRVVVCNRQYAELYGMHMSDVEAGTALMDIVERRIASGLLSDDAVQRYRAKRREPWSLPLNEIERLKDGRFIHIQRHFLPDGGWLTTHEDISEKQRYEARIAHLAEHDVLTDIANRRVLIERLEHAIARVDAGRTLALHWIDLDNFKGVNDRYGHAAGDQVLRDVAHRLHSTVEPGDLVARIGGDEFAVLQLAPANDASADQLASRLITGLGRPFSVAGQRLSVGASIGIATCDRSDVSAATMMGHADHALYQAKQSGRHRHCRFDDQLERTIRLRNQIKADLAKAIVREQLTLHYQPLIDLATGQVGGFEALLRWEHPERGRISPMDFIPLAEETGLIVPIGDWVIASACKAAMQWPRHLRVSVNMSPIQFRDGEPVHSIGRALAASGLEARRLECEITESSMMHNVEATVTQIEKIKKLGVTLALDDFGTGYSSLSSLARFPFDKLKIDRSFVSSLEQDEGARALLRTIVRLGRELGLRTTVEGVETKAQLAIAMRSGCDEAQGYLFKPPVPLQHVAQCLIEVETRRPEIFKSLMEKSIGPSTRLATLDP